jgi:8-oxo-dGTP pyrophosphatase MutT (NUDIX family)
MNAKRYVGVIVKCGDKFLICKRNDELLGQGEWSIPAGKIEHEEEIKISARREFFEETAININNFELEFAGIIPRYTRDGSKMKGLMYTYIINVDKQLIPDLEEAIDGSEHTDCGYFTLNDMKNIKINTFLYKLFEFMSN